MKMEIWWVKLPTILFFSDAVQPLYFNPLTITAIGPDEEIKRSRIYTGVPGYGYYIIDMSLRELKNAIEKAQKEFKK